MERTQALNRFQFDNDAAVDDEVKAMFGNSLSAKGDGDGPFEIVRDPALR